MKSFLEHTLRLASMTCMPCMTAEGLKSGTFFCIFCAGEAKGNLEPHTCIGGPFQPVGTLS